MASCRAFTKLADVVNVAPYEHGGQLPRWVGAHRRLVRTRDRLRSRGGSRRGMKDKELPRFLTPEIPRNSVFSWRMRTHPSSSRLILFFLPGHSALSYDRGLSLAISSRAPGFSGRRSFGSAFDSA